MIWAFMERELDKVRGKIKTIEDLKKKVIFLWNRIPKVLCKNIVNRFEYMVDTVYRNMGNKESRRDRNDRRLKGLKDRKDRKPEFKLKDRKIWKNKAFTEYEDQIERISYSQKTFEEFKDNYIIFLKKIIGFYKKIEVAIELYRRKQIDKKRSHSKNKEFEDLCNNYLEFVRDLKKEKENTRNNIDSLTEEEFWNSLPAPVKENLICTNSLSVTKLDNLIMLNDDIKNEKIFTILKTVKITFKSNEKDLEDFCNKIQRLEEEKNFINTTRNSKTTNDQTEFSDEDDDENNIEELNYRIDSVDNNFNLSDNESNTNRIPVVKVKGQQLRSKRWVLGILDEIIGKTEKKKISLNRLYSEIKDNLDCPNVLNSKQYLQELI